MVRALPTACTPPPSQPHSRPGSQPARLACSSRSSRGNADLCVRAILYRERSRTGCPVSCSTCHAARSASGADVWPAWGRGRQRGRHGKGEGQRWPEQERPGSLVSIRSGRHRRNAHRLGQSRRRPPLPWRPRHPPPAAPSGGGWRGRHTARAMEGRQEGSSSAAGRACGYWQPQPALQPLAHLGRPAGRGPKEAAEGDRQRAAVGGQHSGAGAACQPCHRRAQQPGRRSRADHEGAGDARHRRPRPPKRPGGCRRHRRGA